MTSKVKGRAESNAASSSMTRHRTDYATALLRLPEISNDLDVVRLL
jgi:hypothetical protein